MRRDGTTGSVRSWAARLLVVCALAVCAGAVRAPMHSPDPMPSLSSLAAPSAGYSAGSEAATCRIAHDDAGMGHQAAMAAVDDASTDATGQGHGCDCCAHDVATCCAATTEDASTHGGLEPGESGEHEPPTIAPLVFDFRVNPPASPSRSELSLLRI